MRYLGIDFGTRRVGLALSDVEGIMAYPYKVISNSGTLVSEVMKVCDEEAVEMVVIGESRALDGTPNPLMRHILSFVESLRGVKDIPIAFEPEYFSSHQAVVMRGKDAKHDKIDASAAAIILQSYLDRLRHKHRSVNGEN